MNDTPRTDAEWAEYMKTPRTDAARASDKAHGYACGHGPALCLCSEQLERELAGFCRELGETNVVSAMVALQSMKRELAVAVADLQHVATMREEASAEIERLRNEVKVLRAWGNKDCTRMADAILAGASEDEVLDYS